MTATSKPAPEERPDRRAAIADAAIELLAELGSRGLTHRAIDARLALPDGSTSYYFRTREALLAAVARRLIEVDQRDLDEALGRRSAATALLERWLSRERRARLIARFELFVASARPGEPRPLAAARAAFIERVAGSFAHAGVRDSRSAAITLIAVLEGLLLNELLGTGLTRAARARAIDGVLSQLVSKRKRSTGKRRAPERT